MTDSIDKIQSPCIRNCCLNKDDVYLGCFRTLSEIIGWDQAISENKKTILLSSKQRAKGAGKAQLVTRSEFVRSNIESFF